MNINLQDIKVLIIEDQKSDFIALNTALGQLSIKKVFPSEYLDIKLINIDTLYENYKKIILDNKIDVIFFDLALKENQSAKDGDGTKLIELFISSEYDYIKFLPKIIISGSQNLDELPSIVKQHVKLVITKTTTKKAIINENKLTIAFKHLLIENSLNKTLPVLVGLFRKLSEHIEHERRYTELNNKLDNLINITKLVAQTLPKLTDKKKANLIIEEWEKDEKFNEIMGEYFPNKTKGLFFKIKDKISEAKEKGIENLSEAIMDEARVYFEKEAEIKDDDTKLVKYLKYSAYIAESIGELIHKNK